MRRMRILLADDNVALRQTARQIIEENPRWRVCGEAPDGRTAVELARRFHPDVVILDYKMPLMNGLEAAPLINSFSPRTALVLFTAQATKGMVLQAKASGIRAVVSKAGHGFLELLSFIEQVSLEARAPDSRSLDKRKSSKSAIRPKFGTGA